MYAFMLVVYCCWVVFLCRRLRDVKKHPKKYDVIPGYEQYKRSRWYYPLKETKSASRKYRLSHTGVVKPSVAEAHDIAFVLVALPLVGSVFGAIIFSRPYLPRNETTIRFFVSFSGFLAAVLVLLLYAVCVSHYLVMFSDKPKAILCNLHTIFPGEARSEAWRKMTAIILAATLIVCPLHVLALKNSGYADSERIIYSPFFSLCDKTIEYRDIEKVEILYEDGEEKHCFLISTDGSRFDIDRKYDSSDSSISLRDFVFSHLPQEIPREKVTVYHHTLDN